MRILVVDDEGIVLDSCKWVLEADGFEVHLVPNPDRALEAMKNENFGLLLIDMKMPEHDGMYLMRKVKERWPDLPLIVMSGYSTTETIEEAVSMGVTTFIAKPFTPDELVRTVRQAILREEYYGKKESFSS